MLNLSDVFKRGLDEESPVEQVVAYVPHWVDLEVMNDVKAQLFIKNWLDSRLDIVHVKWRPDDAGNWMVYSRSEEPLETGQYVAAFRNDGVIALGFLGEESKSMKGHFKLHKNMKRLDLNMPERGIQTKYVKKT